MNVIHWLVGTIIVILSMASFLALGYYTGVQTASSHFNDAAYGWSFKKWLYGGVGGLVVGVVLFFIFFR